MHQLLRFITPFAIAVTLLLCGCSDKELADVATPLLCTTPPYAPVVIEGKVLNSTGQPIGHASVTVKRVIAKDLTTVLTQSTTDAAGKYRIVQFLTGPATLRMVCSCAEDADSTDIVINPFENLQSPETDCDDSQQMPSTNTHVDFVLD